MRCALLSLLLAALACTETAASSFGYFRDSQCTVLETLKLEDFCLETKRCKLVSEFGGDGIAYSTPLCAQTNDAIQALFPKGTKLFVYGNFGDPNCTQFAPPTSVYIVDNECHQDQPGFGYRGEVKSDKVVVYRYFSNDCSSFAASQVAYDKKGFDVCESRRKNYFLTGTGEATAASTPGATPVANSSITSDSAIASKENATAPIAGAGRSNSASHATDCVVMALALLAYELA